LANKIIEKLLAKWDALILAVFVENACNDSAATKIGGTLP